MSDADLSGAERGAIQFTPDARGDSTDIAISVDHLSKRFKLATEQRNSIKERFVRGRAQNTDFWALRDVDFQVPRGTTFGLIGHNGSGKSTLLKILAGIYRPSSGAVVADGRISALLELGAGFHGELSGRENVYLNGAILGLTRKQVDANMAGIIEFSGIGEFIDSPVKIYSSGMYVRLGFAIAITVNPEILIVDEIIAVGDEEFQRKCFDYLYELRRNGVTIVLVSHSLGLMADLCDQVAWLDKGELQAVGGAREVIDKYLTQVNAKEAAANADGADDEIDDGMTKRRGSGELRITKLEFIDQDGMQSGFLSTGERATVRMHYEAEADLPAVTFGLGFVHESGVNVAGPNSGYGEQARPVAAGTGVIEYTVEEFSLQPGSFLVSAAAVDHGHTYDYRDRAFELKVRAPAVVTEPGLIQLFGSWSAAGPQNEPVETESS